MSHETTAIKIDNDSTGDYYHSGEQYGDWSESQHNSIVGAEIVPHTNSYDLLLDGIVTAGTRVYILYAEYAYGDSFGRGSGRIEYIAAFKDKNKAYAGLNEIQRANTAYRDYGSERGTDSDIKLELDNGSIYEMTYTPWYGYFERLENVEVVEVVLE